MPVSVLFISPPRRKGLQRTTEPHSHQIAPIHSCQQAKLCQPSQPHTLSTYGGPKPSSCLALPIGYHVTPTFPIQLQLPCTSLQHPSNNFSSTQSSTPIQFKLCRLSTIDCKTRVFLGATLPGVMPPCPGQPQYSQRSP